MLKNVEKKSSYYMHVKIYRDRQYPSAKGVGDLPPPPLGLKWECISFDVRYDNDYHLMCELMIMIPISEVVMILIPI